MSFLEQITMKELPEDQYFKEETSKSTIYVHHTAGNSNPFGVIADWAATPERVATHFVIGGKSVPSNMGKWVDGQIFQCYSTKFWGHHLGLKKEQLLTKSNIDLNKASISIELCNWGPLTVSNGRYLTYANTVVPAAEIIQLSQPYKGYSIYHAYTAAQLVSLKGLLVFLADKWNISKSYHGNKIFSICADALNGVGGIWTHTSVRPDKSDCYPHPQLIDVLKSLES